MIKGHYVAKLTMNFEIDENEYDNLLPFDEMHKMWVDEMTPTIADILKSEMDIEGVQVVVEQQNEKMWVEEEQK